MYAHTIDLSREACKMQEMQMIYGRNNNSKEFFMHIPKVYNRQRVHKLKLLKRHGIERCLNTVFLRPAKVSEAPADYVLILEESGIEAIFILFQWDAQHETAFFFQILPVQYNPY